MPEESDEMLLESNSQGIETVRREIAANMIKDGSIPLKKVAELSGLSLNEIEDIKKDIMSTKPFDCRYILIMEKYLEEHGNKPEKIISGEIKARKDGKRYSIDDYVCGLVRTLLSNNRPWKPIADNMQKIDEIFFCYDAARIKNTEPEYFIENILNLKCGNRAIARQMTDLKGNIETLERIQSDYGSLDAYFTSKEAAYIVKEISSCDSRYKFADLGNALAWEFVRNMGIDGAKPDVHMKRFLGSARMGHGYSLSPIATEEQVLRQVAMLADKLNYTQADIDEIIWLFCANDKGQICTSNPNCAECPISEYCNFPKQSQKGFR